MGSYAFSALLSSVSCYAGGFLLYRHSAHRHLSKRGMAVLFLLAGFFLFTCLRSLTSDPAIAKLCIGALYIHAILLPSLFLDFSTLYTGSARLRRITIPLTYIFSFVLIFALARGTLIAKISKHDAFSFYGTPGPSYMYYVVFIGLMTSISTGLLVHFYFSRNSGRPQGERFFLIAIGIALIALLNTLLPTFHLPYLSWLTYGGYLVPCLVMHAFYGHGFLWPRTDLEEHNSDFIIRMATIFSTAILVTYVGVDFISNNHIFTFSILMTAVTLLGAVAYLLQRKHLLRSFLFGPRREVMRNEETRGPRIETDPSHQLDSLLDIINHDFRSVVVGLHLGIKKLRGLKDAGYRTELLKNLDALEQDAKCLGDMINGVGDIYSAEGMLSSSRWHQLHDIIRDIHEQMTRRFPHRNIRVKNLVWLELFAPRELIYLVFYNLLENSTKYIREQQDGLITIGADKDGQSIVISVVDNGSGIKQRELDRIVIPFVRGTNTSVNGKYIPGRGIGLAVVHKLVMLARWDIKIISEYGKSTTVLVRVPNAVARFAR